MSERPFLPLARPRVGDAEATALARVLASRHLAMGPETAALEGEVSNLLGGVEVAAVSSGGAALLCALAALDLRPGDEVVVPAFTFPAAAQATLWLGATPVAADVDPDTMAVTPATVAAACGPRTRAIVVVHPFGLAAPVAAIRDEVGPLPLIEDAACALGGMTVSGQAVGTIGDLGCFSLHPRKLATSGEGGLVTGRPDRLARVRRLRDYGRTGSGPDDAFGEVGLNFRMSDLSAAVARVQVAALPESLARRETLARTYRTRLADVPGARVQGGAQESMGRVWQSLVVRLDREAAPVREALVASGVGAGIAAHALTRQTFFRRGQPGAPACPVAEALARTTLALPLFDEMADADAAHVVEVLDGLMRGAA
jgi:perosamine synthetase